MNPSGWAAPHHWSLPFSGILLIAHQRCNYWRVLMTHCFFFTELWTTYSFFFQANTFVLLERTEQPSHAEAQFFFTSFFFPLEGNYVVVLSRAWEGWHLLTHRIIKYRYMLLLGFPSHKARKPGHTEWEWEMSVYAPSEIAIWILCIWVCVYLSVQFYSRISVLATLRGRLNLNHRGLLLTTDTASLMETRC